MAAAYGAMIGGAAAVSVGMGLASASIPAVLFIVNQYQMLMVLTMIEIFVPDALFAMTSSMSFSSGTFGPLEKVKVPGVETTWLEGWKDKVETSPIDLSVLGEG